MAENAFDYSEIPERSICVLNDSRETYFVAIDAGDAGRWTGSVAASSFLCSQPVARDTKGFVSIFRDKDSIEGCSRLAIPDGPETLIEYADFDRCTWAGNAP